MQVLYVHIYSHRQTDEWLFSFIYNLQTIYIHIMYELELSLIVQSGIKTAHHTVC